MAIKKLIKYGAIIPSALSGNKTPESEFLLQEITYDEKGNVIVDSKYNSDGELEERHSYTLNQHDSLVSHSVEMPLDEVIERFVYDRNEEISVPEVLEAQYSLTYMDKESGLMILIDDKRQVRDDLKFPTDLWLAEEILRA